MRFATGVEISVTWAGLTVHVVGLRFDPSNVALAEGLRKTRAGRASAPSASASGWPAWACPAPTRARCPSPAIPS